MVKYMDKNSGFNQWNAAQNANAKKPGFSGFLWWTLLFLVAWWAIGAIMSPRQNTENVADASPVVDMSSVPSTTVTSDKISATVQGLRISDVMLTDFAATPDSPERVSLLAPDNNYVEVGLLVSGTGAPVANTVWKNSDGKMTWRNSDGVEFTRTVSTDNYVITITDTINNTTKNPLSVAPYAHIVRDNDSNSSAGVSTGAISYVNSDIETVPWQKIDSRSYAYSTTNGFTGFADQYWATIVDINRPDKTIRVKKVGDKYSADVASSAVSVLPGASETIVTNLYVGPREQSALANAEAHIADLASVVDYGWFWFLARPMLWVLNGINHIVMNYGVAIIIMTILLRLLMWPLTRKSYVNMAAMQKMQPEMQRIQKLYANDKMRLQMEMMNLYKTHKTSPMSGCLPMLIQIPIFFALYKALLVSIPMRNAHFLWISDLASMDPYFILPVLMGATMWLQQYLQSGATKKTSNANDITAQTQKMMRWMPILFTIMFAWMPSGLVLYWTISNVMGIIQMQIIKRNTK